MFPSFITFGFTPLDYHPILGEIDSFFKDPFKDRIRSMCDI